MTLASTSVQNWSCPLSVTEVEYTWKDIKGLALIQAIILYKLISPFFFLFRGSRIRKC